MLQAAGVSIKSSQESKLAGDDLSMVVSCPECGKRGRVLLRQLPHVIHCPSCRVRFWIAKDGKLKSERHCQKIRFECPCCHSVEQIPREFTQEGITCHVCSRRSLVAGDGSFQASGDRKSSAQPQQTKSWWARMMHSQRTMYAVLVGAAILVVTATVGTIASESLGSAAVSFTQDCLQGNDQDAADKVCAGGESDFQSWLALTFSQSKGDSDRVALTSEEITGDEALVRLTIEPRGQGRRLVTQHWRRIDGRWHFDASATLSRTTAPE